MKTRLNLFTYLLATALILLSCEQPAIDPLSGIYTPPIEYDFTGLDSQSRVQEGSFYIFSINLSDNESNSLNLKFVAATYALPASDFTPSETAAKNTYLTGSDGSTCNGIQISNGTLSVAVQDSNYTMNGILYMADESVLKITASFTASFAPPEVPEVFTYVNFITVPATYGFEGTVIEGSQLNVIKILNGGNDTVAAFELITDEGATDLSGDYNVLDGTMTAMNIGDANNGFYVDLSWYGMGSDIIIGGCYYVEDDENQYIRAGSVIHVEDDGGDLTITGSDLAILDVPTLISSSGATWSNLATPGSCSFTDVTSAGGGGGGGSSVTLTEVISAVATDQSAYGGTGFTITLKMISEGVTATYNEATYSFEYTGDGNYFTVDFVRDEGTLIAGTYNIVSLESAVTGDAIAGYEDPYFGTGATWGTGWGTVESDVASDIPVNSGTVEVAVDGDTYTITLSGSTDDGSVNASYSGPITFQ